MAQTINVVGLFTNAGRASAAIEELTRHGFSRGDVETMTGGQGGDFLSRLTGLGAPEADARFYAQGVQSGGTLVTVRTTEDRAAEALAILDRFEAMRMEDQGVSTAATSQAAQTVQATQTAQAGEVAIPIVEEQLQVGKRQVQRGGVRIYRRVEEVPVTQQVQLREEEVHIERRAVNQPVTNADAAFQEGVIEVTETDEVPVVAKQARVVEEVVVDKEAVEHTETVSDTIRRTDVQVEEVQGDATTTGRTTRS